MKRYEKLGSAEEFGFYLTQLSSELLIQLEQMNAEMFRKWSQEDFVMRKEQ